MSNFKLHDFVGKMTKQKKIKSKELALSCGLSRTTLYRHTKGILPISPKVEAAMAKQLQMTDAERDEFRRLISITVQDGSLISARFVLEHLFFSKSPIYANLDNLKDTMFAFHQNDSYLRKLSDVMNMFLEYQNEEMYSCDIKVVGCISKELQGIMQSILTTCLLGSEAVNVEHLLVFPKNDYLKCAEAMLAIMPLLGHMNYNMLYDTEPASSSQAVLKDFILVKVSYRKDGEDHKLYYVLSIISGGLSQIAAFKNEDIYRFFLENYHIFRKRARDIWFKAKNISLMNDYLLTLESSKPQCIIKSDFSYNKIPLQVYQSLVNRSPKIVENISYLKERITLDNLFTSLDARNKLAYKEGNWDVYTVNGLRTFAEKGVLSDHIEWLPAFDANERKIILQSIREHYISKPHGYSMFIIEKDLENVFCAIGDTGLLLKFNSSNKMCQNVVIENKMVADLIFDYVKNHISAYHALPEHDVIKLFDELIESL